MSVIAAAESELGPKAEPKAKIFISYPARTCRSPIGWKLRCVSAGLNR
jgi:hypothetical protein